MSFQDVNFPIRKVSGVHRDAMVVLGATFSDVHPVSILFAQVEAGGVRDEDQGGKGSRKSEPADNPE